MSLEHTAKHDADDPWLDVPLWRKRLISYLFPRLSAALQEGVERCAALLGGQSALNERLRTLQNANTALQRRVTYLEASAQVFKTLATVFEVEPLLEQAATQVSRSFGFYHVGVFLIDPAGGWAVLRAASSTGGRRMMARNYRVQRGESHGVGWVLEHRQPRILKDVNAEDEAGIHPELAATRSAMLLPMITGGRMIGVLDVQSTDPAAFESDDVRALQGLAEQLAVSIDNAQRLTDEAGVLEVASPFYRLARLLATARTDQDIYTAMLEMLREFDPTRALILRLGSEASAVYVGAEMRRGVLDFPEDQGGLTDLALFHDLITLGFTLADPLLIDDLTVHAPDKPEFAQLTARLIDERGVIGFALVPIRVESDLLGVLTISYDTAHRFTAVEERVCRVLADLGAVALERTRLLQEAQARLDRERWIREFGEQVMRTPDLEVMVSQAAQALQDVVHADGVFLSLGTSTPQAALPPED